MKARPERVPASSSSWPSPAPARTREDAVEAALEEERGVAEDRVGLHQAARGVERAGVGDAADAGDLGAADALDEAAPGGGVDRRHRQLVDEDAFLGEQVEDVLGGLQHLRQAVVAQRRLQRAEALVVVGVAREVQRADEVGPARARPGSSASGDQRQRGLGSTGAATGTGFGARRLGPRGRPGSARRGGSAAPAGPGRRRASAARPRSGPGWSAGGRAGRRRPGGSR